MAGKSVLKFGLFRENDLSFDNTEVTSVFSTKNGMLIGTTLSQIVSFRGRQIQSRESMQFSTGIYIAKYDMIIAVTVKSSQIVVLSPRELNRPILSGFSTGHHSVSKIIFSPKSDTIITIGERIKTWKMKVDVPLIKSDVIFPTVSIMGRATIRGKFINLGLSEFGFDEENEWLFLPTADGVRPYNLDGDPFPTASKVAVTSSTVYHYCTEIEKLITADPLYGVCLWHKHGTMIKRLQFGGKGVAYIAFLDPENVIIMDNEASFFILNIRTGRDLVCAQAPKYPSGVFVCHDEHETRLAVISQNLIYMYRVSLPWKVWALNVAKPKRIHRCEKPNSATRILLEEENWAAKVFSPKNGSMLSEVTPKDAVKPNAYYYNRGCIVNRAYDDETGCFTQTFVEFDKPKEEVLMTLENANVRGFEISMSVAPNKSHFPFKAMFVVICKYRNKWTYVGVTNSGELLFYEYKSLEMVNRVTPSYHPPIGLFYHYRMNALVVVNEKEVILYDISRDIVLDRILLKSIVVADIFSDFMFVGTTEGIIYRIRIKENSFEHPPEEIHGHKKPIAAISFSNTFWISCSCDGVLLVWTYSIQRIVKIVSPFPLCSCCILNGNRDIIVATSTELMLIDGWFAFQSEMDEEDVELDNYDRRMDPLDNRAVLTRGLIFRGTQMNTAVMAAQQQQQQQQQNSKRNTVVVNRSARLKQLIEQHQQKVKIKTDLAHRMLEISGDAPSKGKGVEAERKKRLVAEMIQITESIDEHKSFPRKDAQKAPVIAAPLQQDASVVQAQALAANEEESEEYVEEPEATVAKDYEKLKEECEQSLAKAAKNFLKKSMEKERRQELRRIRRKKKQESETMVQAQVEEPEVKPKLKRKHRFTLTLPKQEEEPVFDEHYFDSVEPEKAPEIDPKIAAQIERRRKRFERAVTQPIPKPPEVIKEPEPVPEPEPQPEPKPSTPAKKPPPSPGTEKSAKHLKRAAQSHAHFQEPKPKRISKKAKVEKSPVEKKPKSKAKPERPDFPRLQTPPLIRSMESVRVIVAPRSRSVALSLPKPEFDIPRATIVVDETVVKSCFGKKSTPKAVKKRKSQTIHKRALPQISVTPTKTEPRKSAPVTAPVHQTHRNPFAVTEEPPKPLAPINKAPTSIAPRQILGRKPDPKPPMKTAPLPVPEPVIIENTESEADAEPEFEVEEEQFDVFQTGVNLEEQPDPVFVPHQVRPPRDKREVQEKQRVVEERTIVDIMEQYAKFTPREPVKEKDNSHVIMRRLRDIERRLAFQDDEQPCGYKRIPPKLQRVVVRETDPCDETPIPSTLNMYNTRVKAKLETRRSLFNLDDTKPKTKVRRVTK